MSSAATQRSMRPLLEQYRNLRGQRCKQGVMWDLVVITTADEAQREAFEQQILDKQQRKELPQGLTFHVVADPPGPRIGNGGSTLVAVEFLEAEYGEALYRMKTLLIHAGGWSQRMPSAALLGKVFAAIPHGAPLFQMLDVKIASYLPLLPRLPPGVLLVCADDFVVYDLGEDEEGWTVPSQGVTALAHPSPMELGRSHGVYVVEDADSVDTHKPVVIGRCLEVLQKPHDQRMRDRGALLKSDTGRLEFADDICIEGHCVYTDSCFFFGVDVMHRMLGLKKKLGTLSCEIDAYGDFLQALGPRATDDYIHNTSNISQVTGQTLTVRRQVFGAMRGTDIHLLLLNASQFVHIGTTGELIQAFCQDAAFREQLALESDAFNCWLPAPSDQSADQLSGDQSKQSLGATEGADPASDQSTDSGERSVNRTLCGTGQTGHGGGEGEGDGGQSRGCMMHSVVTPPSCLAPACVVEYCHFQVPITVQHNTIVSNCQWLRSAAPSPACDSLWLPASDPLTRSPSLLLPSETFLHSAALRYEGSSYFVTVFFHIADNLKKGTDTTSLSSLPFLGSTVGCALKHWRLAEREVTPHVRTSPQDNKTPQDKVSLWTLKLFPGAPSMTESLRVALDMVWSVREGRGLSSALRPSPSSPLFSLAEALVHKDLTTMLSFRRGLFDQIVKGTDTSQSA